MVSINRNTIANKPKKPVLFWGKKFIEKNIVFRAAISSNAAGSLINRSKFNGGNELQSREFSDWLPLKYHLQKQIMDDDYCTTFWFVL